MQTFVSKVMSLLFNMLFRFVKAFLSRSKCLLISWLCHSPQWFWSPRKENLSLLPLFPLLFAIKWWGQIHDPEEGTHLFQRQTAKKSNQYSKAAWWPQNKNKELKRDFIQIQRPKKLSYPTFAKANLWKPQIIYICQIPHASLNVTSHFSSKLTTILLQIMYFFA